MACCPPPQCARPIPPFILHGNGNSLAVAVYGAQPLSALVAQQLVGAEGDIDAAAEFLSLFKLAPQG